MTGAIHPDPTALPDDELVDDRGQRAHRARPARRDPRDRRAPRRVALSVPMHVSRPDGLSTRELTIHTPPMVAFGDHLYAPVWALFLVLYPVLSLVFIGVACLAFRWRWWGAGNVV